MVVQFLSRFVKDLGLYSIMVHRSKGLNNGLNLKC